MSTHVMVSWSSHAKVRTSGWLIDTVSVVIADGATHEFMIWHEFVIWHELFWGLSIMSLS